MDLDEWRPALPRNLGRKNTIRKEPQWAIRLALLWILYPIASSPNTWQDIRPVSRPYQSPKEVCHRCPLRDTIEQFLTVPNSGPTAKPGQKTLAELDEYRYVDAPEAFHIGTAKPMEIDHVKTLVEWKL